MATVYVLKSLKDNARYVGMALNPDIRLREHNQGKNRYTKGHIPWIIFYSELYLDRNINLLYTDNTRFKTQTQSGTFTAYVDY